MEYYLGVRSKTFVYSPKGFTVYISPTIQTFLDPNFITQELVETNVYDLKVYRVRTDGSKWNHLFTVEENAALFRDGTWCRISTDDYEDTQGLVPPNTIAEVDASVLSSYPTLDVVDPTQVHICLSCKVVTPAVDQCPVCRDKIMNLTRQDEWNTFYDGACWL